MKKIYLIISETVLLAIVFAIVFSGCGTRSSKKNDPAPQTKTDTLSRVWQPTQLELGNSPTTLNVRPFNQSIPADQLTLRTDGTYTWGADSGNWDIPTGTNSIQLNSTNTQIGTQTAAIIVLSPVAMILQFTGTFYYYTDSTPSVVYTVKRITFN